LRLLEESHDDLTFLVGADQFADFRNWREPGAILELARLAVASRPGFEEEELRPVLAALARPDRVSFFPIPPLPLSSEQIRARVRQGMPIDELVPGAVVAEIVRLGLYRR
jgi:nicotinate-nucleotide adenylyltransferase